jgi:hypothetical protein
VHCFHYILAAVLFLLSWHNALSQTRLEGTVLSASGEPIPQVYVSIREPGPTDIFTDRTTILQADENGYFKSELDRKGMYSVRIHGIYHKHFFIRLLADGQESVQLTIYLIPVRFNDGAYFNIDEYLEWIRVIGNFNDFDYLTGIPFQRTEDGAIHAFIPAQTDTLRFQARGLNYSSGPQPHPIADEYRLRDDGTFESVLYTGLPADSIEIRYTPYQTMPFQDFYSGLDYSGSRTLSGFIQFQHPDHRHWITPLFHLSRFPPQIMVIDQPDNPDQTIYEHIRLLSDGYRASFPFDKNYHALLTETEQYLDSDSLQPGQRKLLSLAYASLLQQNQMNNEYRERFLNQDPVIFQDTNENILTEIPRLIDPSHSLWELNRELPGYLLRVMPNNNRMKTYLSEIIAHHPVDDVAEQAAIALFQVTASEYETADDVPAMQYALRRFGISRLSSQLRYLFDQSVE